MSRTGGKMLQVDRTRTAKKAADGIIEFLRDRRRGKKLVQIFGLPLVGKTTLANLICDSVLKFMEDNEVNHNYMVGSHDGLSRTYVVRDFCNSVKLKSFRDLKEHLIRAPCVTFLVFLDDYRDPDLVNDLMALRNCCFVLTTRQKMQLTKWGPRVHYLNLSLLDDEASKEFICKHLQPHDWSYRLNRISENCQGFPGLLSAVTSALLRESVLPEDIYQCSFQDLCQRFLSEGERTAFSKLWSQVQSVQGAVPEVHIPSLVFMRGSFGSRDAAALSKIRRGVVAKKALIEPLFNLGIVSQTGQKNGDNFVISEIIRSLLEDRYGYLQNDSDLRSRFCHYFAKIFSDLETKMITDTDEFFSIFLGVHPNLIALVERAVYCLKEEYDVLIKLGRQAELIIMSFLHAREVVAFYEACVQAAQERGNKTDYARMLSALGHSLLVICPDIEAAGDRIWEAYDLMKKDPNISLTEIALTTSHKGHYHNLRGAPATSIRYYKEALSIYEQCYEDMLSRPDQDETQIKFLKLCKLRMKNNIAISAGCLGQYDYSIKLHSENINTYQEVFKSTLGTGKAYHCIGLMLHLKGNEEDALRYSRIGLDLKRRSHTKGPSLSVIYSMSLVGTSYFYSDAKDAERALLYLDDALAMIDDLKRNHADRSLLLNSKGTIFLATGDYVQAEQMFREAAEIRLREFGMGANCCTGEALQYLGESLHHLGEHGRAVATLRKCLFLELKYYKQSPDAFECRILETLEWLKKSLVDAPMTGETTERIEFVNGFVTNLKSLVDLIPGGDEESLDSMKTRLNAIIREAHTRLNLGEFRGILDRE